MAYRYLVLSTLALLACSEPAPFTKGYSVVLTRANGDVTLPNGTEIPGGDPEAGLTAIDLEVTGEGSEDMNFTVDNTDNSMLVVYDGNFQRLAVATYPPLEFVTLTDGGTYLTRVYVAPQADQPDQSLDVVQVGLYDTETPDPEIVPENCTPDCEMTVVIEE